jgi:peroxiredoxin
MTSSEVCGSVIRSIARFGAKFVAVSPQTPDESLSTAEKNELAFSVLSDWLGYGQVFRRRLRPR